MCPKPSFSIKLKPNTIILLHGFNSAPGQKAAEITAFLEEHHLVNDYALIAPQLSSEPRAAIREINHLVRQNKTGKVFIIGTSLGGFYANYFRAKFREDENIVVHAINPSWSPSTSLKRHLNDELVNFKTNEKWRFTSEYLDQLEALESFVLEHIKHYRGSNYFLHLANSDKLLTFDPMLEYLTQHQVPHQLFHYDTDHRFGEIRKVMERMIKMYIFNFDGLVGLQRNCANVPTVSLVKNT